MDKFEIMDSEFVQSVWQCGRYGVSESLAKILESDYPLKTAERKMLAALARGEYKLPKNYKSPKLTGEQEREVAKYYLKLKESMPEKGAAYAAKDFGIKKFKVKTISLSSIRESARYVSKIPK